MGAGDWLMATAQIRALNEQTGLPVLVVNKLGEPQWSDVFENNPRVLREPPAQNERCAVLVNAAWARPYIASQTGRNWRWQEWNKAPGEVYLSDAERAFAAPYAGKFVIVEPNTKARGGNKTWAFGRWQGVVNACKGTVGPFAQLGIPGKTNRLKGVELIETQTFRQALAVLAVSRAFVGTEGGLHHGAAALGVPAVVLYSEYITPAITGYAMHKNIRKAGVACGARYSCYGCRVSMEAITIEEVTAAVKDILDVEKYGSKPTQASSITSAQSA